MQHPLNAKLKTALAAASILALLLAAGGCGKGGGGFPVEEIPRVEIMPDDYVPVTGKIFQVNSLEDLRWPPPGTVTLRSALEGLPPEGGTITFAPELNGKTIDLWQVGEEHSMLKGEVFLFDKGKFVFQGFLDRDYGPSALHIEKDRVLISANSLADGITLKWTGGEKRPARVLSAYGDLELYKITVTGGYSKAHPLDDPAQPYTLARGAGLAVWGLAIVDGCTIAGNEVDGDTEPSRDRGAFGGGIYAKDIDIYESTVIANSVKGFGAAGGGIYGVGNPDEENSDTYIHSTTISGNRVTGQHAYGGGVYSDGGGPGMANRLEVLSSTVAANLVEDYPGIDQHPMYQYYYRGGGIYMSNGKMVIKNSTIAENEINGIKTEFNGKSNMGGGGVGATIGNAHVVESMDIDGSIIAGNKLNGIPDDLFSGSLIDFYSLGYNLYGVVDFSGLLAPITKWLSLNRVHYPKAGDMTGVDVGDALNLAGAARHPTFISVGADAGQKAVLWYPPGTLAIDRLPTYSYTDSYNWCEFDVPTDRTDELLEYVLAGLRSRHGDVLGEDFGNGYLTDGVLWYFTDEDGTWPSNPENAPWLQFWRTLKEDIGGRLGPDPFNDAFFQYLASGDLGLQPEFDLLQRTFRVNLVYYDQLRNLKNEGGKGDIGAIEQQQ